MTRRSAFAVAGGVVAALGAGIVATIVNVGVLNASEAQGPGQLRADEPVVRTIRETKKIHKKAKGSSATSGGVMTVSRPGTTSPGSAGLATTPSEDSHEDDGAYEDDDGYEHEFEDEDESEDEDEESEDEEHEFDEGDDD